MTVHILYISTVKRPLKNDLQDRLSLNAGQKYCRMLQREHSAILSTFIKVPGAIKTFVLSIFEWPFYTVFTVLHFINWAKSKLWSISKHASSQEKLTNTGFNLCQAIR